MMLSLPSRYTTTHWRGVPLYLLVLILTAKCVVHSFQIKQPITSACFTTAAAATLQTPFYASSSDSSGSSSVNDYVNDSGSGGINDDDSSILSSDGVAVMDDGGQSDLTDRFKYKVHALMGTYDTPVGVIDDENQTGRIIGAVLNFPTEYTFSVVGKTNPTGTSNSNNNDGGDYANSVKCALTSIVGSDSKIELRVVPRGTKFTRVTAKVTVESASIISSIYAELGALDGTVMKF